MACQGQAAQTKEYSEATEKWTFEDSRARALIIGSVCLTILALISIAFSPLAALGGLALATASWVGFGHVWSQSVSAKDIVTTKGEEIKNIVSRTINTLRLKISLSLFDGLDEKNKVLVFANLWTIAETNTESPKYGRIISSPTYQNLQSYCASVLVKNGMGSEKYFKDRGLTIIL